MKNDKLLIRNSVAAVLFLCGFFATNWIYNYHEVFTGEQSGNQPDFEFKEFPMEDALGDYQAAGFPQRYLLRIRDAGVPEVSLFRWQPLLVNIAVWFGLLGLSMVYEWRIYRSNRDKQKRGLRISDLLVLTIVVAILFSGWQSIELQHSEELAIAEEIASKRGNVVRSAWLPISGTGPFSFYSKFMRIKSVAVTAPDDDLLRRILALENLSSLQIGGGNYDLRLLDPICRSPFLRELRISGRTLDPPTIATIGGAKQLVSLNLMRTNVTSQALLQFGEMPRLKYLNLIHTDVKLSEMSQFPLSMSLRGIALPHPADGEADHLKLEGWPELKYLVCNEYDEGTNNTPITIELSDFPKLEQIMIDGFQIVDLKLNRLPSLIKVDKINSQWESRLPTDELLPRNLRVRRLGIEQVPKLQALSVHGPDLEAIELREPNLATLAIGSYSFGRSFQSAPSEPLVKSSAAEGLGASLGPIRLVLQGDISKTEFSTIAQNSSIQFLDVGAGEHLSELVEKLGKFQSVKEISLGMTPISGRDIAELASKLPNLERIHFLQRQLGRLRIEDNDKLISLGATHNPGSLQVENNDKWISTRAPHNPASYLQLDALRLVNATKLADRYELPLSMNYVYIENVPCLKGLVFHDKMPKGAVLKGLRDLDSFTGGGQNLNDDLLSAVLECDKLEKLILAYASASPESLSRIGTLKQLKVLVLTGTKVDDQVVRQWTHLRELRTLHLDNVAITDQSMEWIGGLTNLESLSIEGTRVTATGCRYLEGLKNLKTLRIGRMEMTADVIRSIASLPSLRTLDLSGTNLNEELIAAFIDAPKGVLERLILNGSEVNGPMLLELAQSKRSIVFELDGVQIIPSVLSALEKQERLYVSRPNGTTRSFGEVDPGRFAPDIVEPASDPIQPR